MGMHPVSSQENSLTKGELVLILKKKIFFAISLHSIIFC